MPHNGVVVPNIYIPYKIPLNMNSCPWSHKCSHLASRSHLAYISLHLAALPMSSNQRALSREVARLIKVQALEGCVHMFIMFIVFRASERKLWSRWLGLLVGSKRGE